MQTASVCRGALKCARETDEREDGNEDVAEEVEINQQMCMQM